MKKVGKLLAVLFVVGLTSVACSNDEYYEEPGVPVQPIAPGVEHPIAQPPIVAPAN